MIIVSMVIITNTHSSRCIFAFWTLEGFFFPVHDGNVLLDVRHCKADEIAVLTLVLSLLVRTFQKDGKKFCLLKKIMVCKYTLKDINKSNRFENKLFDK